MNRLGMALAGALLLSAGGVMAQTKTTPAAAGHAKPTASAAQAAPHGQKMMNAAPAAAGGAETAKPMTVTGEIVELSCYLDHGAKGEGHKACATKCINDGSPMGVLTSDGHLYLLTLSHVDEDPYTKAKTMAAETVKVTGSMHDRDGMQAIEVTSIEMAGMAKPATTTKKEG